MQYLRANTQVIVTIGPFVDVGDGFTPETGITLGAADEAELVKHGSTSVVDISGATWAAVTGCDGYYSLTLTTSHTDTEGQLIVVVQDDSVCLPVVAKFSVLAEAAWDSMFVAKDDGFMDVNIKTVGRADTQETEASNLEAACAAYSATRGLAGTALPAAAADAAGGLPISDAGGLDLDSKLANTNEITAARMGALTDWINGGRLDLILDDILADTGTDIPATLTTIAGYIDTEIGTLTTELAKVPKSDGTATWNATALASIQTEANDALVANNLDHLVLSAVDTNFATTVHVDSVVGQLAQTADGGYDRSTDSLEANRDNIGTAGAGLTEAGGDGDHLTAINLPNQTMDIVGNITGNLSGSVGSVTGAVGSVTGNVGGNVTGSVGSLATQAKADVNAEVDSAIETYHLDHLLAADYDPASKPGVSTALLNELVENDVGVSRFTANALEQGPSGSAPTAAQVADAVWDEARTGHTTIGTFGYYLNAQISSVGGAAGSGANEVTVNVKYATGPLTGQNIADAQVWITSDAGGDSVVAGTLTTNSSGNATFLLDALSVYYLWCQKDGVNAIQGQQFTATAD